MKPIVNLDAFWCSMTSISRILDTTFVTFGVYHNMLHVVVVSYVRTFDVILKVMCHAHMKFEGYFENN
jgi:hypothetical protein